ncbi:hypothetical protein [Actinomadura atramentaria]|uniref:hypothetical protein n=1 Tax=Actinomadura atramentaria TaxID=1990 RepID=UPI00035C9E4F|nr:hypothetical protein [Actinomadura atramentaria]
MPAPATAHATALEGVETAVVAELLRLERVGATGVLRVGDAGAFHLEGGAVVHAAARGVTGLDRLVVAAGPGAARDWGRVLLAAARPDGDPVAEADRAPGLGRARLELFALFAALDAADALLDSTAVPDFAAGPAHWLAPVCRITPAMLLRERARRRARLDAAWPDARVDTAPLVPARRVHRQRVILTGLQTELLLNADDHSTPADLALTLGRSTFACRLAARFLAATALIQTPPLNDPHPTPPTARGVAPTASCPQAVVPTAVAPAVVPAAVAGAVLAGVPGGAQVAAGGGTVAGRGGVRDAARVPVRAAARSAALATGRVAARRSVAADDAERSWTPPDPDVLLRLRAALEELA